MLLRRSVPGLSSSTSALLATALAALLIFPGCGSDDDPNDDGGETNANQEAPDAPTDPDGNHASGETNQNSGANHTGGHNQATVDNHDDGQNDPNDPHQNHDDGHNDGHNHNHEQEANSQSNQPNENHSSSGEEPDKMIFLEASGRIYRRSGETEDNPNLVVQLNDLVRVEVCITSGTHDWVITELDVATSIMSTGACETVEFVADQAGDFEYFCSVGAHRAQGMFGTLTVQE